MIPQIVDITSKTGQHIIGSVTSWQTPDGPFNVEHLAGMSINGDLLVFYWSPRQDWTAVNVTSITGQRIASPVTSWQTPDGPFNVEHLAGMSINGDLLVFYWSPRQDWTAVNVTQITGQKILGPVTSWQVRDGPVLVEYLAGRASDGSLYVFWWSPGHDWQVINISQLTERKILGPVTSWLAGTAEHLAGQGEDNSLLVFWWTSSTNWQVVNVSNITGEYIDGIPSAYQLIEEGRNSELLSAKSPNNSLQLFWYTPSLDWQSINISDITDQLVISDPQSWVVPSGPSMIEHFAAEADNNRLLVLWGDSEPRRLTSSLSRPFQTLSRQHNIRRNVVAVLWKIANDPNAYPVSDIQSIIFGNINSVRQYYLENSGGNYTIEQAAVLGWYDADYPAAHYFGPPDVNDTNGDGWINGHVEKWAEGIRKASANFDFSRFDANLFDGSLSPLELGILFVMPGTYPFGTNRPALGREYPQPQSLVVNGVTVGMIAEVYIGNPLNLGVSVHELAHLLLEAPDMYFNFSCPYAAGDFSIMDNAYRYIHMDPFLKLKYGWLRPKIIFKSGTYILPNVEGSRKVLILMDPRRGPDEYFILENRFPANTYDRDIPDSGLGVWHIIERPEVYGNLPPPPGVSTEQWNSVGRDDWGRRAIRLIRPVLRYDPYKSLWDGSDPDTGYDLLSVDPNPQHAMLKWADNTPTGFAVRSISPAGRDMSFRVDTPF
jgi:M6 family metalloprotease-like protein